MLGSSMLWSVAPLTTDGLFSSCENRVECPEMPESVQRELSRVVAEQRRLSRASRVEEAERIFSGLRIMLRSGDRRVLTLHELAYPLSKGQTIDSVRLLQIAGAHADLQAEALQAHERADDQYRWYPGRL